MAPKLPLEPNVRLCTPLGTAHPHITQCAPSHYTAHYQQDKTLEALLDGALGQCAHRTLDRTLAQKTDRTLGGQNSDNPHISAHCKNDDFETWFSGSKDEVLIPFDEPYLVKHYDKERQLSSRIPYTQINVFDLEIARARVFLKNLYVRGVDIEITAKNALKFVPMPNHPSADDLESARNLQHGIRYQINYPIDLYQGATSSFLDDRNTCISCKHLTAAKSCRKDGKGHVTWIDRQWLDKKINCTDWIAK
jgi:hypothetical protein